MTQKRYEYPTGNIEFALRLNQGEPFTELIKDIKTKWTPGNEYLWDDYDPESFIDTPEKCQYAVNKLLYSRITVYRALRDNGEDTRGSDPFEHAEHVPNVLAKLKDTFPDLFE